MITFERFEEITYELAQQLPEEFFRKLDGGVMAREAAKLHPQAVSDDLYILGEYHRDPHLSRFVVLYYGSFMKAYGYFLHHLESLAGERDLEIQDAIQLAEYRQAHGR